MPELPEVETVRRGLEEILDLPKEVITKIEAGPKKLRYNASLGELNQVAGETILSVQRKAKYLLFELNRYYLLSHLGMTGSWRIESDRRTHDHIRIFLKNKRVLTYHDPRRFGFFEIFPKRDLEGHPRFSKLGLDPVLDSTFDGAYLHRFCRNRKTTIKALIMNQEIVVGVGNIYASEALYLAGISPLKKAEKVSLQESSRLAESIREVLWDAILCGGSTISDFVQAGGSEGYFQNLLLVYGRENEECHFCGETIKSRVIVGRNSFWCPVCQKI